MCRNEKVTSGKLLDLNNILNILENQTFYTEYQPLVCVQSEKVIGYEALARFEYQNKLYSPDVVFSKCHENIELFYKLEMAVKKKQFENRIKGKILFVNFDPHILLGRNNVKNIFEYFSSQNDFVIELVENSHVVVNTKKLVGLFQKHNYQFAVDDFFKENSMISMCLLNHCKYLKLDKDILHELQSNDSFYHIVDGIVKFAHSLDIKTILEGVETQEDVKIAKRRGIDLVQGFLYKKQFVHKI